MIRLIWLSLFVAFTCYTICVYLQSSGKENQPDDKAIAGMNMWQNKNCQSCHQLYGLGGYMGPDLTNTASEKGKGADYMRSFITVSYTHLTLPTNSRV